MSELDKSINTDTKEFNTNNIFDEFEVDEETKKDIENITRSIKKDNIFYFNKIGGYLKIINYVLFIVGAVLFLYILVQNSINTNLFKDKEYLSPFCFIINEEANNGVNCSSVSISLIDTNEKIKLLKEKYLEEIISILENKYELDSIKNSKESIFMINKHKYKNDPVFILNKFDLLKNDFTSIDKGKIQCRDIFIKNNIFEAKCSAFSYFWDEKIPGLDGKKINLIGGTSITLASSFINYLSKNQYINIINKQKNFSIEPYFGEGNFTYKTDFDIKFEYDKLDFLK